MSEFVLGVGLVSAVLICLGKWGVLDWYQVKRKIWMPDAGCFFCLGFWLSSLVWLQEGAGFKAFFIALCSAPFINIIVNYARGEVR